MQNKKVEPHRHKGHIVNKPLVFLFVISASLVIKSCVINTSVQKQS